MKDGTYLQGKMIYGLASVHGEIKARANVATVAETDERSGWEKSSCGHGGSTSTFSMPTTPREDLAVGAQVDVCGLLWDLRKCQSSAQRFLLFFEITYI